MIYTVTLNPALDKTVEIPNFRIDEVNRVQSYRVDPGGKGINVSKVIKSLGGESVAMGILAGHTGQQIERALTEQGIMNSFVYVPGETRTNVKVVDSFAHTNTDINEAGPMVAPEQAEKLLQQLLEKLKAEDVVVLSGSAPQGLADDIYARWTQACSQAGAKVFLDADGKLFRQGVQSGPFFVKPNRAELEKWAEQPLKTEEMLIAAGRKLQSLGVSRAVISLGADGALYFGENAVYRAESLTVPVGSTVGAGDSMVAALAYGWERGLPEEEIFRLAVATAAANVMCSGSQAAQWTEIESLLPRVRIQKII